MNPRFETINGKLCIMLEKPIPLTKEAKFPCIVRLIQDDSPMGRYNQSYSEYRYGVRLGCCMLPIIATHIAKNGVVNDIEWDVSRYEIIGYPVADGSNDWALYQMMQGEKVCHEKSQSIMYCEHAGYIRREVRYNCVDHMSVSVWLNGADNTGWQIYEEPEPAMQYKVGDWLEWHEGLGTTYQSQITRISHSAVYSKGICIPLKIITRKLKPSEVIVNIGCLSGTVERRTYFDTDKFFSLKNPEMEMAAAVINIDALDTPTRELVESLLKAQEEE